MAHENRSRELLVELAQECGVATEYWDFDGNHQQVSDATLVATLAALGHTVSNDSQITSALESVREEPWRRILPPCVVATAGQEQRVLVHVPHGAGVQLWVELADTGERLEAHQVEHFEPPRMIDGEEIGEAAFVLPDAPLGWHYLVAAIGDEQESARVELAITPQLAPQAQGRPEFNSRNWGVMAQLYSVRSRRSWGIGDLADLTELARVCGEKGADFILINPLHAAEPSVPLTPSPYLPTTRRFVHPIYIRPEEILEAAYLPSTQRTLLDWGLEEISPTNELAEPLDRDAVWQVKLPALETIFGVERSHGRQQEFARFCQEMGKGLEDFALWCAVYERFGADDWPLSADVSAATLRQLRVELADRIEFHMWLQWIVDEQLARAQESARNFGMELGIMHDLAVGVHPEGADSWTLREALAQGISVGAPADMYNQQGQDWSQPPWRPDTLAAQAYRPLREMLRTILRHAGALRLDHVMGLFRLWWIPNGMSPHEGTYVRYDHEAMIGVVVLEAHLAGAVLIGEDLGTVEPWVREYLASRGILGTSILWFETQDDGYPLPPQHYRREVLATVTTHDLPPTAGYLADEHVELRERLGLLTQPVAQVRLHAQMERERMARTLRDQGLLPDEPTERQVVEALHRYIARTPASLIGVALTDAVGERRAQNQPGTDQEYPNWKIPLADGVGQPVLVEDLPGNVRFDSLVAAVVDELQK